METRRESRIDIELKITAKVSEGPRQKFSLVDGKSFEIEVVNISKSGASLLTKYFFPRGLIIEMQIEGAFFGLKEMMKIKGEICYCRYAKSSRYRCGIKFLDIAQKYQKAIAKFNSVRERRKDSRLKFPD